MFKDILVPMLGRRGDMDALNAGVFLAASEDAHLTVLQMVYMPTAFATNWARKRDVASGEIGRVLRSEGESNAARLRSRLETESIRAQVKLIECDFPDASETVAEHAHHTDLTIVTGALGDKLDAGSMHAFLGSLFLASGGPVIVVPPRCKVAFPPRRIVVAWRPTREATRALHDAMPLLMKADAVDVVIVEAAGRAHVGRELAAAQIVEHLAQHAVNANLVVLDAGRRPTSSTLLEHVRLIKAGLLVVGGYGHTRLREAVLGGVTRELLISATIPVLYSH
ncbi:MAG TPA: universal stress protein [Xanthomonadaceae bacterium]|jgi:nucleotide-binding universal stress UspA family protein|nr:universal stress protein [Xanthomonadaceae bacterium]